MVVDGSLRKGLLKRESLFVCMFFWGCFCFFNVVWGCLFGLVFECFWGMVLDAFFWEGDGFAGFWAWFLGSKDDASPRRCF